MYVYVAYVCVCRIRCVCAVLFSILFDTHTHTYLICTHIRRTHNIRHTHKYTLQTHVFRTHSCARSFVRRVRVIHAAASADHPFMCVFCPPQQNTLTQTHTNARTRTKVVASRSQIHTLCRDRIFMNIYSMYTCANMYTITVCVRARFVIFKFMENERIDMRWRSHGFWGRQTCVRERKRQRKRPEEYQSCGVRICDDTDRRDDDDDDDRQF